MILMAQVGIDWANFR